MIYAFFLNKPENLIKTYKLTKKKEYTVPLIETCYQQSF